MTRKDIVLEISSILLGVNRSKLTYCSDSKTVHITGEDYSPEIRFSTGYARDGYRFSFKKGNCIYDESLATGDYRKVNAFLARRGFDYYIGLYPYNSFGEKRQGIFILSEKPLWEQTAKPMTDEEALEDALGEQTRFKPTADVEEDLPKTAGEHFKAFLEAEGIYDEFKKEYEKARFWKMPLEEYIKELSTIAAIGGAFFWDNTEKGHRFWQEKSQYWTTYFREHNLDKLS